MKSSRHPVRRALRDVSAFFADGRIELLPALATLRRYDLAKLRSDSKAALNVTLLGLPQGMAFAAIAGLPIIYGILCAAVAALVAPLFSGSRYTILGPTNATAFMLFSFFAAAPELAAHKIELVPLLVLMVGVICTIGALLKVADLLQYISRSVLVGYITGAAVLIIVSQMRQILGLGGVMQDGRTFVSVVANLFAALPATHWQPLLLSALTLATFFLISRKWPRLPSFAVTLLASALLAAGVRAVFPAAGFGELAHFQSYGFEAFGMRVPDFSGPRLFDDLAALSAVAFAIAFLASLESSVMSKTLASRSGERSGGNQDMFALGLANLACSLSGGMPASGSLTRSTLNFQAGARTRFASLLAGALCLLGAVLLAWLPRVGLPVLDYLPQAGLAALVVAIAVSLINLGNIRICLRSTGDDAAVLIVTFLATLLAPLHVAIFIGVTLSITLFLRKASKPYLVEYEFSNDGELREKAESTARPNPAISIVHVEGDLFFGASELFRTQIQRIVADPNLKVIILRMRNARHLDATSVIALQDLVLFIRRAQRHIIISGAPREIYRVLKKSGVLETLQAGCTRDKGESNLFMHSPSNPNISTRFALKRAQQLLGTTKADIRIFYDPNKEKEKS
jgi:SulP family sulfate permease